MESTEPCKPFPPAFIFGVPRSGTTLLVRLLGAHPLIAPLYETRFLRNLARFCAHVGWLHRQSLLTRIDRYSGVGALERFYLQECRKLKTKVIAYHQDKPPMCIRYTAQDLEREVENWLESVSFGSFSSDGLYRSARELVERLFAIHCERMNKRYWINKTPGLLNHLEGLARLFPDAKCVHIVRDGRDVALSNLGQTWGPNTIDEAARRWNSLLREGRAALAKQVVTFMEVRYEDLIGAPAKTLEEILTFFGIEGCAAEMLDQVKVHDQSVGAWRKSFKPEDRRIFDRAAGDLLTELAYEKDRSWCRR